MRVLITGNRGQLGTDLTARCVAEGDEVIGVDLPEVDLTDRDATLQAILTARPDVVFHTAAWTAVDDCESDPAKAFLANALAVRWVAEGCRRAGAHLVHISTDYVFDGTKEGPYHEWDVPAPRSIYGASKLAGEQEARALCPDGAVVRTAWVMGRHGKNMLKTVLSLRDRDELAFVDDQRGCPTFTADLATGLRALAARRLPGTYHLTNEGDTTWYGFVRDVLEAAGEDPDKVRAITTAELDPPRPAPRPANSVLARTAWEGSQLPGMPHYRDSLRATVGELLRASDEEIV